MEIRHVERFGHCHVAWKTYNISVISLIFLKILNGSYFLGFNLL